MSAQAGAFFICRDQKDRSSNTRRITMTLAAEKELEHIGETSGCADHDHDLVHELSKRLDSLWRYDQYIANAQGHSAIVKFWKDMKKQEQTNIGRLKELITEEIKSGCF
jgi:GH15 family glucan-1,4-alpha-glucosidase